MDRRIIYPEQQAVSTDLLSVARDSMIAVGKLFEALGGSSTKVDGLACAPATGLNVSVAAGQIYQLKTIDSTAYSELGTDTHPLVKQGVRLDSSNFSTPAPGSGGQSINYLIQCRFEESDTDNTVVPYYDVDDPTVPLPGPNGDGTSQPTTRKQICAVAIKNGTAATTGAQVTPTPDAGWTGIWVVTVAFGETSVSAAKIVKYAAAPFLGPKGGGKLKRQIFLASGTFTPEAGVTSYRALAVSPGGAGVSGDGTSPTPTFGGGTGAYWEDVLTDVTQTISVTIGAAGLAATGPYTGQVNGTSGGTTVVGSYASLTGGGAGNLSTAPGAGGVVTAATGTKINGAPALSEGDVGGTAAPPGGLGTSGAYKLTVAGYTPTGYGTGGTGTAGISGQIKGGDGGPSIVIFEWIGA